MAIGLDTAESFPAPGLDPGALELYEVVDGQIVENPSMGAEESILASFLHELMGPFARSHRLGRVAIETLFWLDRSRKVKRRPDLAFVSDERWPLKRRVPQTEAWDVIPDLAAEFVSESSSANSVLIKIQEYFRAGVKNVWVVYPVVSQVYIYDSPARVRILELGGELDGEDILPGFRVAASTFFQEGNEADGAAPADDPRGD